MESICKKCINFVKVVFTFQGCNQKNHILKCKENVIELKSDKIITECSLFNEQTSNNRG